MSGKTVPFPEAAGRQEGGSRLSTDTLVDDTRVHLLDYWRLLKRNKWIIIAIALVGGVAGFYKAASEPSIYQATATMLVEPRSNQISSANQIFYSYANTYCSTRPSTKSSAAARWPNASRTSWVMIAGRWKETTAIRARWLLHWARSCWLPSETG